MNPPILHSTNPTVRRYTLTAAARATGYSRPTLDRLVAEGKLPATQSGPRGMRYVTLAAVEACFKPVVKAPPLTAESWAAKTKLWGEIADEIKRKNQKDRSALH